MTEQERGSDRLGRRAKRFLTPLQKYEIWLQLLRGETTIAEAADRFEVDRSTIMRLRRAAGELEDHAPGGSPMHGLLDWEVTEIIRLFEQWGEVDHSHRKLAHRGSYLERVWVSPSSVRRVLEHQGLRLRLLERVSARQDGLVDPTVDDPARPVLLALSDNGPQMTSGSTREFMALCAIHQHFGRPGTPTDQAWTWVAVRPRQGRMAAPERHPRPGDPARRARRGAGALQRRAAARRDRLRHPQRRARGSWSGDPQGAPGRTRAGPPPAACLAP